MADSKPWEAYQSTAAAPSNSEQKPWEAYSGTGGDESGAAPAESSLSRRLVGDTAVSALKGAIAVPETVVGLADIPTGGWAGKLAEKAGFRPKAAKAALDELYSPEQRRANEAVQKADGFVGTLGAIAENPSTIPHAIVESAFPMLAGGVAARGLKAAGVASDVMRGAMGEGIVGAGSAAEQMRQESGDGLMSPTQAGLAVASGAGTAAFGALGGTLANRPGIGDVDTLLSGGTLGTGARKAFSAKEFTGAMGKGAISEGAFEELPQSMWEQAAQNLAAGKPWDEGLGNAAAMGFVTGVAMGAGGGGAGHVFDSLAPQEPGPGEPPPSDPPLALPPPTYTGTPGGQLLMGDVDRQRAMDEAQANADAIYAAREQFEQDQKRGLSPSVTLTTDPAPLQQRIDTLLSVDADSLRGVVRKNYERALEAAFGEPVGVTQDENGLEIPFTMGDYLASKVKTADIVRDAPRVKATNEATQARLSQLSDEEASPYSAGSLPPSLNESGLASPGAVQTAPSIPVVGPLSAAANHAVISGAAASMSPLGAAAQTATGLSSAATPVAKSAPVLPVQSSQEPHASDSQGNSGIQSATPGPVSPAGNAASALPASGAPVAGSLGAAPAGSGVVAVSQQSPVAEAPAVRDYDEAQARSLAVRATKQGLPSAAYPHPTMPGRWAIGTPEQASSTTPVAAPGQAQPTANPAALEASSGDALQADIARVSELSGLPVEAVSAQVEKLAQTHGPKVAAKALAGKIAELGGKPTVNQTPIKKAAPAAASVAGQAEAVTPAKDQDPAKAAGEAAPTIDGARRARLDDAAQEAATSESNDAPQPTEAQKEAGNYRMGHVALHGLDISIENPQGSERSGTDPDGKAWSVTMAHHYGYIRRTEGNDGDHVDAFVGPNPESQRVFIVDQKNPKTGAFDEHKVLLGFDTPLQANAGYSKSYAKGWSKKGVLGVTETTVDGLKTWLKDGDMSKPFGQKENKTLKEGIAAVRQKKAAEKAERQAADKFASNKVFTADKVAAARARLKSKLGTLNSGIDPELLIDGMTIAGAYVESGIRSFGDYAAAMVDDFGDKIKPYLLSFYEAARAYPGIEKDGMTPAEDAAAQHQALMTPSVKEAAKEVIGETPKVTRSPKAKNAGEVARLDGRDFKREQPSVSTIEANTDDGEPGIAPEQPEKSEGEGNGRTDEAGRGEDKSRAPEVSGGRGPAAQHSPSPADSGHLEGEQPENVPETEDAGRAGSDGVRVPASDVGGRGPDNEVGDAVHGRKGNRGEGSSDAGARERERVKNPEDVSPANPGPGNFHIDNPLEIVGGGQVARFDKNRAAIDLLNAIREEGRQATAEEQRTLAGYTGWGSFGQELFQGTWERPMPKEGWGQRDAWLREHLGADEWKSAQRSITNAHYTDPPTVMAMWDMVKRMGFPGGRVLEPSMGIGNFFGMMPADLKARSQLAGIELDSLTGAMAKLLYPASNIKIMGYQESKTPDNFYDVVIGNWPFENTVIADRRYMSLSPYLHDYFFLKALDQVRPGGLVVGITSSGTMDKKATKIRAALARKAELVTSIRLPSGAFKEYAGTSVVTDIVILKKREKALVLTPNEPWINSVAYKTPAGPDVFINGFYVENPRNVIGTIDYGHGTTRMQPGMIVNRPENMAERLREAVALVPEGAFTKADRTDHISYVTNHTADREGSLTEQDGLLFVVRGEHLAPAAEVYKYALKSEAKTAEREAQLRRLIDLRRKYAALIEAEREGHADATRKALRDAYEDFEEKHGPLSDSYGLGYLKRIDDPFYPALAALNVDGKPSDILTKSTMRGGKTIETPGVRDAYVLARNTAISPSLAEIAEIANKPAEQVKAELVESGAVFELPNGDIEPSDLYLSGNVRQKLREAQAALEDGNKAMARNVEHLKAVIPADIPYFNIESQLGATWVPAKAYAEYVAHMLNRLSEGIEASFTNGRWKITLPDGVNHTTEANTGFGTTFYPFSRLVNAAFTNQTVKIRRKDSDGNEYLDTEATDEANARIADMREKFAEWLWSDPERRVALEAEYNEARNAFASPKYDGSFLAFHGMALSLGRGPFNLRQHQADAVWRAIVNRRSINAHEVGTGKTFTMGGIAIESRRYGIAKKPMILAHNANSASVASEIQMMYPAAKILYIDNLSKDSIGVRMRQIANDDWDAVVVPHSLIDRLAFREETLMQMAAEDIRSLEEEAYAAAEEDGVTLDAYMLDDEEELKKLRSVTAKELVKARNRIIETIKKQAIQSSREDAIPFEDLGIDMILVDEVHEFKKPPISTRMSMKGLNTAVSNRSIALQFITRYIRANNFGGNVHTFTGTPITNTLTEIFHQMRYVMEEEMKAAGVDSWDGWFGSFAKEVQDIELSAAGEYEAVNRLAGFINVPELRRMIGQYMDVVFAEDMPEMQPRTVGGKTMNSADLTDQERAELLNGRTEDAQDRPYKKVVNVVSDLTPEQTSIFSRLQGYARRWREMGGKERIQAMRNGAPESPIITEGLANKASFDVRLTEDERWAGQEGQAPDDPGSKAAKVVANALEIYNSDPRAAQVIFSDVGYSTSQKRSAGRNGAGDKLYRTVKTFSTVRDIVERLVQGGVPREQIAVVDGSTSKEKRKEIAAAMNALGIRVVIGSTDTLGVGVNMQRNLRAMHHMDAPYMPGELEQRNGRGFRQGNQWNTVLEYRYMTDRLDGRRWQILAIKQRFINAFMKAKGDNRVIEGEAASDEESDILQSFSEAAGDPRILIRAKLQKKVESLQRSERMHGNGVADARTALRRQREQLLTLRNRLDELSSNDLPKRISDMMAEQSTGFVMEVEGKSYDKRADADEAIKRAMDSKARIGKGMVKIGNYRGNPVTVGYEAFANAPSLRLQIDNEVFESSSLRGLEQQVRNYAQRIASVQSGIEKTEASIERLEEVSKTPFGRAADLEAAQKRLAALEKDIEINPVPPPAWLRAGAPVDSSAYRNGNEFVVTGHRWTRDGWFVLAQDEKGEFAVPYLEVADEQGMPLYEEHEFTPPEVIEKESKSGGEAESVAQDSVQNEDGGEVLGSVDQTESETFKRWFGDSRVVDANDPDIRHAERQSGKISLADKAVYGMATEGKSAEEILKFVASGSRSLFYRQVARLLLKTGIAPKITVGDGNGWKFSAGEGHKYAAAYNPKTDTVALFRPAEAERHMLHELVHAATLRALASTGLGAIRMRALFAHVKKSGKLAGTYGMSNVDEFVTEAFTNPKFQARLKSVSAPAGSTGIKSAWHWFIRVVRGILGLPANSEDALSAALEIGVEVMRENRSEQAGGKLLNGTRYAGYSVVHEIRNSDTNRSLDGAELQALRRAAASLERPEDGIFLRVTADGYAIRSGPKGARIPESFRRFAADNGLTFRAERKLPTPINGQSSGATTKTEPMPISYRESGAMYFGEMNDSAIDRTDRTRYSVAEDATNALHDLLRSDSTFNLLHKTVATQYHKASVDKDFKRVFDLGQKYLLDTSRFAMDAADEAPNLLQKLGSIRDIFRVGPKRADVEAIASPVFRGTLEDKVFSDSELRGRFKLTDKQIGLYRESRVAINKSLDDLGASVMANLSRGLVDAGVIAQAKEAGTLDASRDILHDALLDRARALVREASKDRANGQDKEAKKKESKASVAERAAGDVLAKAGRIAALKAAGYAPLMRFGQYSVDVVEENPTTGEIERKYFGMYETQREANKAARELRETFPNARVDQGIMDSESWKMFGGVDPSSLEVFADAVGADESAVFQDYLRLTKNNRDAMKRMIERKGIEGFSKDTQRVLSGFVTSNARLAARNYHFGDMKKAVVDIPKQKGDVKGEAAKLVDYLQNPQEEAVPLRSYLFVHFMGGSIASALTNLTQPITMTAPYLAQFGGAVKAGEALRKATSLMMSRKYDPDLEKALKLAEKEGVTEPHEIHQLYAESTRSGLSRNMWVRKGLRVWGSFFALAESFNRTLTFIAAYNMARDTGNANPFAFAQDAVESTQGVYNKGNRPNWARGSVGSTVFTFKQFSIGYIEFLARLAKTDRKAFALALAIMAVGAGAEGLPFAEDIEDLLDTLGQMLGYATNTKAWLRKNATEVFGEQVGDFVRKGVSRLPGMPIDISGRVGVQNLIPGTSMFKVSETDKTRDIMEFVGPMGGFIQSAFSGADALRQGNVAGAVRMAAPLAVQNAARGLSMAADGFYSDARGRKVVNTDSVDAMMKGVGFQPNAVARESAKINEIRQDIALTRTIEAEIADKLAAGIFEKDTEKMKSAMEDMADWNRRNPDHRIAVARSQITSRLKAMNMTRQERFVKSAPKEMRAAVRSEMTQ